MVSLAVIEHVKNPERFLHLLAKRLSKRYGSKVVLTTPNPSVDWGGLGSRISLFRKHANEEHEALLNWRQLEEICHNAGFKLTTYRRFLWGANQLAVFKIDS